MDTIRDLYLRRTLVAFVASATLAPPALVAYLVVDSARTSGDWSGFSNAVGVATALMLCGATLGLSGAYVGWRVRRSLRCGSWSPFAGAILGILGSVAGTFGVLAWLFEKNVRG